MPAKPFEPLHVILDLTNQIEMNSMNISCLQQQKKKAAAFLEIMKLLLKKESTNLHLA